MPIRSSRTTAPARSQIAGRFDCPSLVHLPELP
jgi:hypothetical protein